MWPIFKKVIKIIITDDEVLCRHEILRVVDFNGHFDAYEGAETGEFEIVSGVSKPLIKKVIKNSVYISLNQFENLI